MNLNGNQQSTVVSTIDNTKAPALGPHFILWEITPKKIELERDSQKACDAS